MPKPLSKMRIPDPFVMDEDTVNILVWKFLKNRGFNSPNPLQGNERGVDVQGEKLGWKICVESKGSHANNHNNDTVFGQGQIKVHTYNQIGKLMEYQGKFDRSIFVMANPDIPRIRKRVNLVSNSLDILGFVRFWVQQNGSIKIEYSKQVEETLYLLGLIDKKK